MLIRTDAELTEDAADEDKQCVGAIACLPGLQNLCRKTHSGLGEDDQEPLTTAVLRTRLILEQQSDKIDTL